MQSTVDLCQSDERNVSKAVIFVTYSPILQGFGRYSSCEKNIEELFPDKYGKCYLCEMITNSN